MLKFKIWLRPYAFGTCAGLLLAVSGCGGTTSETTMPAASSASSGTAGSAVTGMAQKININKAPIAELDKLELPGTKPSLSERIQGARPYKTSEDLVAKKAISQDELNLIKNLITVGEGK